MVQRGALHEAKALTDLVGRKAGRGLGAREPKGLLARPQSWAFHLFYKSCHNLRAKGRLES